jgi:hypothetical protein
VTFNLKPVFTANAFLEFLDQALVQVYALSAAFADQMMVVFARLDQLIAALAITQVDGLDQTLADKRLQRTVDSRQSRSFFVFVAQQPVDVLGAGEFVDVFKNI